jgi:predicted nucleic acid-binding protein
MFSLLPRSTRGFGGIHLAVMERQGVDRILSFDRGFDEFPGIERIGI